jgi:hypothetical protein
MVRIPAFAEGRAIRFLTAAEEQPGATACHILIIEDQSDSRLVPARLLERLGHPPFAGADLA